MVSAFFLDLGFSGFVSNEGLVINGVGTGAGPGGTVGVVAIGFLETAVFCLGVIVVVAVVVVVVVVVALFLRLPGGVVLAVVVVVPLFSCGVAVVFCLGVLVAAAVGLGVDFVVVVVEVVPGVFVVEALVVLVVVGVFVAAGLFLAEVEVLLGVLVGASVFEPGGDVVCGEDLLRSLPLSADFPDETLGVVLSAFSDVSLFSIVTAFAALSASKLSSKSNWCYVSNVMRYLW